jgi:hypothetical protein
MSIKLGLSLFNRELWSLPGAMRADPNLGYNVWLAANSKLQRICDQAGINFFEDIADVLADIQAKFTSEYPHVSLKNWLIDSFSYT